MWASPQLSFYSYFYCIFIGWCPHSPQVTCAHIRDRRYIPHDTDVTAVIPIHLCQDKKCILLCIYTSLTNTHIIVSRYIMCIVGYSTSLTITQTNWWLTPCHSISHMCIPCSLSHNWTLLRTVCLQYNKHALSSQNCWEAWYTMWQWQYWTHPVCVSLYICHNWHIQTLFWMSINSHLLLKYPHAQILFSDAMLPDTCSVNTPKYHH
jgi:hypothetical protein